MHQVMLPLWFHLPCAPRSDREALLAAQLAHCRNLGGQTHFRGLNDISDGLAVLLDSNMIGSLTYHPHLSVPSSNSSVGQVLTTVVRDTH